jgi:dienelactone hydrolase
MRIVAALVALVFSSTLTNVSVRAEGDLRATNLRDLNSQRTFPSVDSKEEWRSRAGRMRERILVSCGLWPMPEKTPLNAKISGRIDHDGYSVEKVYFESYPGFFVAGNLYRPRGIKGPFPAVLNPHGHWAHGRLNDEKDGSIPARCINFAKQGYIAFAYDMVGYNDTFFADQKSIPATTTNVNFYPRHREFATNSANLLWNISLMGLQTWDSIRALDFLTSLPEVDKKRIGVTGASGGATQTIMLGAIDSRITVQAPVCMVSGTMQGGCACETAPGLRVDYSNMEFAALPAPRPQLLVAATGDWTKMTLSFEGPMIAKAYRQFEGEEKLHYVIGNFNHNYNQTSREQVYAWFAQWLKPKAGRAKEVAYEKDADEALRVFGDGKLPETALGQEAFIQGRIAAAKAQYHALLPKDAASLVKFKKDLIPAWKETLQLEFPESHFRSVFGPPNSVDSYLTISATLVGTSRGEHIPAMLVTPVTGHRNFFVVMADPLGKSAFWTNNEPIGLAKKLLDKGASLVLLDTFLTGDLANEKANEARLQARKKNTDLFFSCYNRTDLQERVQDLITACTFAREIGENPVVVLYGAKQAGLWAALAAPAANAVIADCNRFDSSSDKEWLAPEMFVPGVRKIGGIDGVAALGAPNPILLHNTGEKFEVNTLSEVYERVKASRSTRIERNALTEDDIVQWLASLGKAKR